MQKGKLKYKLNAAISFYVLCSFEKNLMTFYVGGFPFLYLKIGSIVRPKVLVSKQEYPPSSLLGIGIKAQAPNSTSIKA